MSITKLDLKYPSIEMCLLAAYDAIHATHKCHVSSISFDMLIHYFSEYMYPSTERVIHDIAFGSSHFKRFESQNDK